MAWTVTDRQHWDLATESIVVRIRWFGILMGIALVLLREDLRSPLAVGSCLILGAIYTLIDTASSLRGAIYLSRYPLFVSMMEALFIGLLCYYDTGLESPFRYYYLLSLICCAFRYRPPIAWATLCLDLISYLGLAITLGWQLGQDPWLPLALEMVILAWVTWASSSLAGLVQRARDDLRRLNGQLEANQTELEARVADRTAELRASQARLLHQEKMANFGLLAAGIAHEVGNPLAGLSNLIQILQRRKPDSYTAEKLELADRQLTRIRRTIRELIDFSRPGDQVVRQVRLSEAIAEALNIAKYYQRTQDREVTTDVPADLPRIQAVPDHLLQIALNLILNAIDATGPGGSIHVRGEAVEGGVVLSVKDDGRGIPLDQQVRVFEPYVTTKPGGTGLGLYVCQSLVQDAGGTLQLESQPGRGTQFTAWFPNNSQVPLTGHPTATGHRRQPTGPGPLDPSASVNGKQRPSLPVEPLLQDPSS